MRGTMCEDRQCVKCERVSMCGEPDACLGYIPGVSHACCGPGWKEPYVVIGGTPNQDCKTFPHVVLRGSDADAFFALVRAGEHYA